MSVKLLELCLSPDLGGLELFMLRCAQLLKPEVSVVNPDGRLRGRFEKEDLPYLTVKRRKGLGVFGTGRELARIIDSEAIDIVHVHWTKDLLVAVLAKKMAKRPLCIAASRHMKMTRFKNDPFHRWVYKNIDAMHAVTQQLQGELERFIPEQIRPPVTVIYPGAKPVVTPGKAERETLRRRYGLQGFAVVLAGRIEPAKGQALLLEALSLVKRTDVHIYFAGHAMTPGYEEQLRSQAKTAGIAERVVFLGFTENIASLFAAADAVVLATNEETFGLVLIEAMHAGTAVIGSNRGGVLEIIDDEESGLLFESGNAGSLARSIDRLASDEALRLALAAEGMQKAREHFDETRQFRQLDAWVRSCR